jgi:uncharacterized membrane protein YccC
MWRSLVARPLWERKVAGSNPVIPTPPPAYELKAGGSVTDAIRRWLHQVDPGLSWLRLAVKLAIVGTLALIIGEFLGGNPQLEVFASFGVFALLLFANFSGDQRARLSAYIAVFVLGAVLIVLGTLAATVASIAVVSMAVVGFTVTFAGVLSAAAAGATRALLLTFILGVTVTGAVSDIPARLAGWGLAAALGITVAVFVYPPREHDAVRSASARACQALAAELAVFSTKVHPSDSRELESASVEATQAVAALSVAFRNTAARPVGLTTGSRLLAYLVDQIDWLQGVIMQGIHAGSHHQWSDVARRLVAACGTVLESAAATIAPTASSRRLQQRVLLQDALDRLARLGRDAVDSIGLVSAAVADLPRTQSARETPGVPPRVTAGQLAVESPGAVMHELVYTTGIAGQTVAASAAADARPLFDRLIGRWGVGVGKGPWAAAYELASRRLTIRSVWLRNSIRAALGLAIAVLLAQVTHVEHSFWIVLGTLSVLRTTAVGTGATAMRALAGTLIGFLVGAGLVYLLGTTPAILWILLPPALLVAGFAPTALSFVAGQAAFTVLVVILFNLIDPVGWTVGLVRIEDVVIGCVAAVACGVLLWPAGAASAMRAALADSHRSSADALASATRSAVDSNTESAAANVEVRRAGAAAARVDDAIRSYLADRGSKPFPLHEVNTVANGARRVRVVAEAIASTRADHLARGPHHDRDQVIAAADSAAQWYHNVAAVIEGSAAPEPPAAAEAEAAVLSSVASNPATLGDANAERQLRKLWAIALHVDGVTRLQARLTEPLATLARSSMRR